MPRRWRCGESRGLQLQGSSGSSSSRSARCLEVVQPHLGVTPLKHEALNDQEGRQVMPCVLQSSGSSRTLHHSRLGTREALKPQRRGRSCPHTRARLVPVFPRFNLLPGLL